jgi:hypothetical protein
MLLKEYKPPGVLKFSENGKLLKGCIMRPIVRLLSDRGMSIKEFLLLTGVMVLESMVPAKEVVVDSEP